MRLSRRTRLHDNVWRDWLLGFPDYIERGHIPAVRFRDEVREHLLASEGHPPPDNYDLKIIERELDRHFRSIASKIKRSVDGGLIATAAGLIGVLGDFILPGFSLAVNTLAALLIAGGGATTYSAKLEIKFIAKAELLVADWLIEL